MSAIGVSSSSLLYRCQTSSSLAQQLSQFRVGTLLILNLGLSISDFGLKITNPLLQGLEVVSIQVFGNVVHRRDGDGGWGYCGDRLRNGGERIGSELSRSGEWRRSVGGKGVGNWRGRVGKEGRSRHLGLRLGNGWGKNVRRLLGCEGVLCNYLRLRLEKMLVSRNCLLGVERLLGDEGSC